MEPLEFVGLAKLLGVAVVAENDEQKIEPRSFTDVFSDIMKKFNSLGRTRKREIIRLIKKSNGIKRRQE